MADLNVEQELNTRRIAERMLHALGADATDANIARLNLFSGMLASMAKGKIQADAIEAFVMGIDVAGSLKKDDVNE